MPRTGVAAPDPPDPHDIVALVSRHVVLCPFTAGVLRGTCPFCGSTAFQVRPGHGTYCCFRCGAGGDARQFATAIDQHH
ncbi:CHC2 zinc finger domain-containing protein [Saccharothrix xinjiangensis]|uniref:CHC2 zinc finger domain-containing protein n=1 Tax=Saccharothrix xinjiangensis TaxID=204798 RepID=A0ABV9YAI0_9PSEU